MEYKNIYITLLSQFCAFLLTVETDYDIAITRDAQSFQKDRCHLKIQGARRVMLSKVRTEDTQILSATTKIYSFHSSLVPGISAVLPCTMNTAQITWD
jgi:hypothetical protein